MSSLDVVVIAGDTSRTLRYHTLALSLPAAGANLDRASIKCRKFRLQVPVVFWSVILALAKLL
jgi:hypothetical protein